MDAVEDIKNRLSVEDVVGEYVELKRAGRNFKGLSPFNSERSASFMVSPEKQIWHDFSSGKGGNIFSFIMEIEGVDFKGALEILARKAGIDLSLYNKGDGGVRKQKDKSLEILELATKYYQHCLLKNSESIEYVVKKRKFNKKTMTDFRIGYSPNNGSAMVNFLRKRGFNDDQIKSAGLTSQRYNGMADMFRGRIMIPLMDPQGSTIGFTARVLKDEPDAPKYINTPQTVLYDKSRHVFALSLAKDSIRRSEFAVIVEGNLDVMSSHQAGFTNVVATGGTALTTYHLKALQRFTSDIRLSFDQDRAGVAAAERAIGVAQGIGVQLSIISIPSGKDPDELIQKNPSAWEETINKPQEALGWLIDKYLQIYDISTAHGKRAFSDVLLQTIVRLDDSVEQDHYLLQLAKITDVSEAAIRAKLKQVKDGETSPRRRIINSNVEHVSKDPDSYQDKLLCLLVASPTTRSHLQSVDSRLVFSSPERQRVYEYIEQNPYITLTEQIPEDLKDVEDYVKILLLQAEEHYPANDFGNNEKLRELIDLIDKLKRKYKNEQLQALTESIRQAEDDGDEILKDSLLSQYNLILKKK